MGSVIIPVLLLAAVQMTPVAAEGSETPKMRAVAALPPLASLPMGERWYSLVMNDERTGFGFIRVQPHEKGYEIFAEGSVKMLVLGFSREAASRERYLVDRDLSIRSFDVEQVIDGSAMKVTGERTAKGIRAIVEASGKKTERLLKNSGKVFPAMSLNLYPLVKGFASGRKYPVQILDVEAVKVKKVTVTAVGVETLPDGTQLVHLQNDLYPFVSNDVWVDREGNTVRESVRDGMIETRVEPEQSARQFLVESALAKKDLILDFSRIPLDEPIDNPGRLGLLKIEISGFHKDIPLLQGAGQQARQIGEGHVLFSVTRMNQWGTVPEAEPPAEFLVASERIPTGHPEIADLTKEILRGEQDRAAMVRALAGWVAHTIKESVTDSYSPIETLARRTGNCQSHARLYVSLARTAGIPSRFVSGLVHVEGKGLLYHSWAESFIGRWVPVDPTFDEVPADATHVKLVEGDSPEDLAPLVCLIGRIRARVVEKIYLQE